MSVTRTTIYAEVTGERIYKDENGVIQKESFEDTLANCDTRMKANIILEKEYKGQIVSIESITFKAETRKMSDDTFYENSEVVKTEEMDENTLLEKANSRKRK